MGEERAAKLRRAARLITFLDDKPQFFAPFASALAARLVQRSSYSASLEKLAVSLVRPAAPHELGAKVGAAGADGVNERRQPGAALAVVDRRQLHRRHPFVERLFDGGLSTRAREGILRGRVDEAV